MTPNRLRGQIKGKLFCLCDEFSIVWNICLLRHLYLLIQALQAKVAKLSEEETDILKRQELLKKELYGRFGDSINLEN